jgi:hypothetical protein
MQRSKFKFFRLDHHYPAGSPKWFGAEILRPAARLWELFTLSLSNEPSGAIQVLQSHRRTLAEATSTQTTDLIQAENDSIVAARAL